MKSQSWWSTGDVAQSGAPMGRDLDGWRGGARVREAPDRSPRDQIWATDLDLIQRLLKPKFIGNFDRDFSLHPTSD